MRVVQFLGFGTAGWAKLRVDGERHAVPKYCDHREKLRRFRAVCKFDLARDRRNEAFMVWESVGVH